MTISTFGATPPSTASISAARHTRLVRSVGTAAASSPITRTVKVSAGVTVRVSCQRQCLKNRRQLVIAVVSQVPDGKVEIHLGRGPDDYGAWNDGEHKEQQ